MATIGLSRPYVAQYANAGNNVSYSAGRLLGKATELSIELNDGNNNIFYANNGPAEADNQFSGGTLSITTDDLRPEALIGVLGVVKTAMSVSGVNTPGAAWLSHNDNQQIPFVGFGVIAKKKVDGVIKYVGIILDKVQFANPNDAITTQGETIEWQAPQLTATIYRSDKDGHDWKTITTPLDTEAEADAAVRSYLGISEASVTPSLSSLSIGALTLDPTFSGSVLSYTTATTNAKDAVTAVAANAGDDVSITVNGAPIASGDDANWVTGSNIVKVTVTNSGGAQYIYTVTVSKSAGA